MTWTQRIYDAFGPSVTDHDVAAALWYFTLDELESLLQQAETELSLACSGFLSARAAADKELGPGWQVVQTDNYYDKDLEREFEQSGYAYGEDIYSTYWLIPKGA